MTAPVSAEVALLVGDPGLRQQLATLLESRQLRVRPLAAQALARTSLPQQRPDLLLLDLSLPDGDGLSFLAWLPTQGLRVPTVVLTDAGASADTQMRAFGLGASDVLQKPFDEHRLMGAVRAALEQGARLDEIELSAPAFEAPAQPGMAREPLDWLLWAARGDAPILLHGERGVGKAVVARALHEASGRRDGPFVALSCSTQPPALLELELFGLERGLHGPHGTRRGLVEAAHGGTLFLDEVGELSSGTQTRLLQLLKDSCVTRCGGKEPVKTDLRVICTTRRDLQVMMTHGAFRMDLLYRLSAVAIRLPSLRERPQELPGLISHFLQKHAARHRRAAPVLDDEGLRRARAYAWPGNTHELEGWVESAVVLGGFEAVASSSLAAPIPLTAAMRKVEAVKPLAEAVAQATRSALRLGMLEARGKTDVAARLLGVTVKELINQLSAHDLLEERWE